VNAGIFLSEKKVPTLPDNISARTRSSAKSVTDSKKGAKPKGGKLRVLFDRGCFGRKIYKNILSVHRDQIFEEVNLKQQQ